MCFNAKKKFVDIVAFGAKKFATSIKKFFNDAKLIQEIDDRADKTIFLGLASNKDYKYVESIREGNIYDSFVEMCYNSCCFKIDLDKFIDEHYGKVSKKRRAFLYNFFSDLSNVIYEVISENAPNEIKTILKAQEVQTQLILKAIEDIKKDRTKKEIITVLYCASMQRSSFAIKDYSAAISNFNELKMVDLSLKNVNHSPEDGVDYWLAEAKALRENFDKRVAPLIDDGISVGIFALAPIPLLILLGYQFRNRPNVNIFQLRKSPASWVWSETAPCLNIKKRWHRSFENAEDAVIILSFCGKVNINNVKLSMDNFDCSNIVELYIDDVNDDFLSSYEQLVEFIKEYRIVKAELDAKGAQCIHLFASIPISFAISIGQTFNANFDHKLITYDFKQGKYTKALIIGDDVCENI